MKSIPPTTISGGESSEMITRKFLDNHEALDKSKSFYKDMKK